MLPASTSIAAAAAPVLTEDNGLEAEPVQSRILRQARLHFFAHGYSRFRMDDLATELGMSKKTLYVHFAGKDAIILAIIDDMSREIRADVDALLHNRNLGFAEKLRGFVEGMAERLAKLNPANIRDLQRYAPALHDRLTEVRERNIPYVFGRFVEEGQLGGFVRTDLPPGFAIEFYLHAMHGLLTPAALERLHLAPRDIIRHAVDLFFGGLLTPTGRKQYEKLFNR